MLRLSNIVDGFAGQPNASNPFTNPENSTMKQSINCSAFIDAFHAYDRYDQFGYDALEVLFDYLEQLEEDCGEELELDVIALCCEYSVDSPDDIAEQYSIDLSECEDDQDKLDTVTEWLSDNTSVCGTTANGAIVYCSAF
jgi:hypothetical protein